MKLVELKIIGLSYSASKVGQYILVLGERKGNRKLPIIIKQMEAEYIALSMENIKTKKPLIQDLLKKVTDKLGGDLYQVKITNILEGVFYTKLLFHNMEDEFEVECSIGDAVSLSMTYKCGIFCTQEVLKISGIEMDDEGNVTEEQFEENHRDRNYSSIVTVDNLEKMLEKALENEEYEIASQLRDRILELKKEKK